MLEAGNTALIVIDVQGKLARLMHESEAVIANIGRIVRGAHVLDVPIVCTEQNPDGLGPTVTEIAPMLAGSEKIAKFSFSCWGEEQFVQAVQALGRRQILLAGIETHVCVYQTAVDMLAAGYEVQVVADAVSSRSPVNKAIGIEKMKDAGAAVTCVETALFEMLRVARGPEFKEIIRIVK